MFIPIWLKESFLNKIPLQTLIFKDDFNFTCQSNGLSVSPLSVVSSWLEKEMLPFYVVHLRIDLKTSISAVLRRKKSLEDNFNFSLSFFIYSKLNCKTKGTLYMCT